MKITLIAAMDCQGGIGKNGRLPWHIPEDLKHFKEYTADKVVVMGRKTWDSLPVKPLPNRHNLIMTGSGYKKEMSNYLECIEVWSMSSVSEVVDFSLDMDVNELCIIGGASIYERFLPRATHMVLTHINGEHGCDTFFPGFYENDWTLTGGKQLTADALVRYWERK